MANLNAVLTRPNVRENYARNAFDRGFSPKLHYQLGQLTPFFAEPFIAGSHVKLNRSIFQRTARVNTAAFPKVDTHCEFFFVPLRLVWSFWNNYKLNMQDFNQSIQGNIVNNVFYPVTPYVPQFNLYNVKSNIRGVLDDVADTLTPFFSTKPDAADAMRLLDLLGYGDVPSNQPVYTTATESSATYMVNAFKLAAYQKVYYDYFRNTAYEGNDPTYYNLDYWSASGNNVLPPAEVAKLLTLRYVNYRKDYFQSIYPALNYVSTSPNGLNWELPSSVIQSIVRSGLSSSVNSSLSSANPNGLVQLLSPTANNFAGTSVQNIRAAFALDKLLRASSYAPKHVRDQFEARYGVKGVENDKESVRIGAFMNDIVFQEVTAMNSNSSSSDGYNHRLGDIGGKGVGFSGYGKDIEFTCKEDGIILGLIYSLPRTSYDSRGLKNWNGKIYRPDFFIPEFMDLGLQPMYASELKLSTSSGDTPDLENNYLIGYHPRYSEYKIGIDENHGLFNRGGVLSDFTVHSNNSAQIVSGAGVNSGYFKVKPTDMDSIFVESSDPSDWTTDKFITYIDVKCICNQNMSVHGQPSVIG